MRVLQIARKDFMDSVRGRQLPLLVALFGIIGGGAGYFLDQNVGEAVFFLMTILVPLLGLVFTHHSIAGKRNSGELTVLLGLPFSRRTIVVGTYLGRVGLLVVTLCSLYLGAIVAGTLTGTTFDFALLAGGFVLLAVLGTVFISIALGISTATASPAFASVASFVTFLVFVFQLWPRIPDVVLYAVHGFDGPAIRPTWALAFEQLSPFAALRNAAAPVFEELVANFPLAGGGTPSAVPFYMHHWFALIVLVCWVVLPVLAGYLTFNRSDL